MAVERYIYFPASRRQFGSKSKALLELRRDETPQSGMLMTALNVLLRTHRRTFRVLQESGGIESARYQREERPPWDVRQVLQQERQQASPSWSFQGSLMPLLLYSLMDIAVESQRTCKCWGRGGPPGPSNARLYLLVQLGKMLSHIGVLLPCDGPDSQPRGK